MAENAAPTPTGFLEIASEALLIGCRHTANLKPVFETTVRLNPPRQTPETLGLWESARGDLFKA